MEEQNIQQPIGEPVIPEANLESKGAMLYFGVILVVAVLIIGGYLAYRSYFMPHSTNVQNQANTELQVTESNDQPIKTVADQPFQSETDLKQAMKESNEADVQSIQDDLDKNEIDSKAFSM